MEDIQSFISASNESSAVPARAFDEYREDQYPAACCRVLISGMLTKEGRKFARISFTRGEEYAEFIVPDGILDKRKGFTEEEVTGLYRYVRENRDDILTRAKEVSPLKNWLGLG